MNEILLRKNPRYLSELQNLPEHERESQLYGGWFAEPDRPQFFHRSMVRGVHGERVKPYLPSECRTVRAWDKAATEYVPKLNNTDADFSACMGMAKDKEGNYYIYGDFCDENYDPFEKVFGKFRKNSAQRDQIMLKQAEHDGKDTLLVIARDAGADGKQVYEEMAKKFISAGFKIRPSASGHTQSKFAKFENFLSACQAGIVYIVESSFRDARTLELVYRELEAFNPDPVTGKWKSTRLIKDDWLDSICDCFNLLAQERVYTVPKPLPISAPSQKSLHEAGLLDDYY